MLLTDHERRFLAAFIHEATTDPFAGPATEDLHRRDIYYTDLSQLLAAYYQEFAGVQEGFGSPLDSPTCPWEDLATVVRRNREVDTDLRVTDLCNSRESEAGNREAS